MRTFLFCFLLMGSLLRAAQPIKDEAERLRILSAIFPGMSITKGDPYPRLKPAPNVLLDGRDALDEQPVYRAVGKPTDKAEMCASEHVASRRVSEARELRFVAFQWPPSADLVAVVQYKFVMPRDGTPAGACWSIGRIVHLNSTDGQFRVVDNRVFDTQHHGGLGRIELSDIDADGVDELMIESDSGGAGNSVTTLMIYAVAGGRLRQLFGTEAAATGIYGVFEQVLDIKRTQANKGGRFCFTRTDIAGENLRAYVPRRVTHPCYEPSAKSRNYGESTLFTDPVRR